MSNNCVVGSKNSTLSDLFRLIPPVTALDSPLSISVIGSGYMELATVYPLLCTVCASAAVGTKPGIYSVCGPCPARMVTMKPLVGSNCTLFDAAAVLCCFQPPAPGLSQYRALLIRNAWLVWSQMSTVVAVLSTSPGGRFVPSTLNSVAGPCVVDN